MMVYWLWHWQWFTKFYTQITGKAESRHKTILGGGSSSSASISLHRCVLRDCCDNRVHCPFCDIRQYKPAQPARVRDHLHLTHFQHAVYYDGMCFNMLGTKMVGTLMCCVLSQKCDHMMVGIFTCYVLWLFQHGVYCGGRYFSMLCTVNLCDGISICYVLWW